jgi:molybdopterin/thiamine biosynthesis adenylyltransferase
MNRRCSMINRYDRQELVPGWNQQAIETTKVVVISRGWVGTFLVWALASMGVREIIWVGRERKKTSALANFLLAMPSRFDGCVITDYPFDPEKPGELEWVLGGRGADLIACCAASLHVQAISQAVALRRGIPFLSGSAAGGGWFGTTPPLDGDRKGQHPIVAMIVSGLLADQVREMRCESGNRIPLQEGELGLEFPVPTRHARALLIGVGAVGTYAAVALAVAGYDLSLVDFDVVEETNLPRQGLFNQLHVQEKEFKATAARDVLSRLFPETQISASVCRVDNNYRSTIEELRPTVIVSAVDNAKGRLDVAELGRVVGPTPVVNSGTDVFAADVFVQDRTGPELDTQMYGALSIAAGNEASAHRQTRCNVDPSYVVPGLMAGAMAAGRAIQAAQLYQGLSPMRWRAGCYPAG